MYFEKPVWIEYAKNGRYRNCNDCSCSFSNRHFEQISCYQTSAIYESIIICDRRICSIAGRDFLSEIRRHRSHIQPMPSSLVTVEMNELAWINAVCGNACYINYKCSTVKCYELFFMILWMGSKSRFHGAAMEVKSASKPQTRPT